MDSPMMVLLQVRGVPRLGAEPAAGAAGRGLGAAHRVRQRRRALPGGLPGVLPRREARGIPRQDGRRQGGPRGA